MGGFELCRGVGETAASSGDSWCVGRRPPATQREIAYWGDLDTHGFAILSRLHEPVPTVRSMLMDRSTSRAHREQFAIEPNPPDAKLQGLTPEDAEL